MRIKLSVEWPNSRVVDVEYDLTYEERHVFSQCSNYVRADGGNLIIHGIFRQQFRVQDKERYCISRRQNGIQLDYHEDTSPKTNCHTNIVLLLESPHKDEYDYRNEGRVIATPRAPAMGQTGNLIREHLACVLKNIAVPGDRIIIANPIQFQASLYVIHRNKICKERRRKLTNAVWKSLWGIREIRERFLTRIDSYNPRIIINACTSAGRLNEIVDKFLECQLPDVCCYQTSHPASWWAGCSYRKAIPCRPAPS